MPDCTRLPSGRIRAREKKKTMPKQLFVICLLMYLSCLAAEIENIDVPMGPWNLKSKLPLKLFGMEEDVVSIRGSTDNFQGAAPNTTVFRSLTTYEPTTLFTASTVFTVIVAPLQPWVIIADSDIDPGNLNGTRTYSNYEISGLLIDYLEDLATYYLNIQINYVFPCKKIDFEATGSCGTLNWRDSLQVLKGNESYYTPSCSQPETHCFALNIPLSMEKYVSYAFLLYASSDIAAVFRISILRNLC